MSDPRPLVQIVLRVPPEPLPLAGIPAVLRAAHALSSLPQIGRIVLTGASEPWHGSWASVLRRVPGLSGELLAETPTVALCGDGIPDPRELSRFCAEASRIPGRTLWIWRGEPIAAFFPASDSEHPGDPWPPARVASRIPAAEAAWTPVRDPAEARAAEVRLFAALGKRGDGFLSRFDRRISTALSRRLVSTAVTPNQITWASIVVGLAGALAVASQSRALCVGGTLLVWLSAILDGCDGEIARLKLLASEAGARLDLLGDHVVNFAVLAAIAVHVHRVRPEGFAAAALLLAVGVGASALTVAWLQPADPSRSERWDLAVERLASRDFVYFVIPLAALGRLDWFFWGASVGSNLFWLSLWALRWRRRSRRPRDTASHSTA